MGKGGNKGVSTDQGIRPISVNELKKHNRPGDAWIAIFGKVNIHMTQVHFPFFF